MRNRFYSILEKAFDVLGKTILQLHSFDEFFRHSILLSSVAVLVTALNCFVILFVVQ